VKTFKKTELKELLDGETDELEKVSDTITSKSRWSVQHSMVFREKATGRFFRVGYSEGATEQQDESPFEYEPENVKVEEVRPVKRTVTVYEPVTPEAGASKAEELPPRSDGRPHLPPGRFYADDEGPRPDPDNHWCKGECGDLTFNEPGGHEAWHKARGE
jgi:hypothetical protein